MLMGCLFCTSSLRAEGVAQGARVGGSASSSPTRSIAGAEAAPVQKRANTTTAAGGAARPTSPSEVPKDPENRRGISPFWEKIVQGDTAAIAHDYSTALSYYQAALTFDPKNPVGHLRMAEVSLKQQQLEKTKEYLDAAFRFSEGELRLRAQVLFLTARYYEQKNTPDEAILAWARYKALSIQAQDIEKTTPKESIPPAAKIYVLTADRRTTTLETSKERALAYESVKERIQKNVAAADQATGAGPAPAAGNAPAPAAKP